MVPHKAFNNETEIIPLMNSDMNAGEVGSKDELVMSKSEFHDSAIGNSTFFPGNIFLISLLASDVRGKSLRNKFYLYWGFGSILIAYLILSFRYQYNSARSFFVATTTITTIGYGPIYDPNNHDDHQFLSLYFIFLVFPFNFFQCKCYFCCSETIFFNDFY
jgi:hypothetical protein